MNVDINEVKRVGKQNVEGIQQAKPIDLTEDDGHDEDDHYVREPRATQKDIDVADYQSDAENRNRWSTVFRDEASDGVVKGFEQAELSANSLN